MTLDQGQAVTSEVTGSQGMPDGNLLLAQLGACQVV